jgi:hypothetical protein
MGAGTGLAMQGQRQQAEIGASAAEYNAAIAERNAAIAERDARFEAQELEYSARMAEKQGKETARASMLESRRLRTAGRRLMGTQRALFAKAGVLPEGTPLLVQQYTAAQIEMDARLLERGGLMAREDLQAEAGTYRRYGARRIQQGREEGRGKRTEAGHWRWRGKNIRRAGRTAALTTLLSGAREGALTTYQMRHWADKYK